MIFAGKYLSPSLARTSRLEINLFTPIPYQYYIHEVHDGQMNGDSLFQFRNPKNKSHQLLYTVTKLTQIQIPLVSVIRVVGANRAMSHLCWLHVIS